MQDPPIDHEAHVLGLADRYYERVLLYNPTIPLYVDIDGARHDQLPNRSREAIGEWRIFEDSLLVAVRQVDPEALIGSVAWITHGVLLEELEASIGTRVCRRELWNVNQMGGWHGSFQNIARRQPVGTDDLRAQALSRFGQMAVFVDVEIGNLETGLELGRSAPKTAVELVIQQIDGILAFDLDESPLLDPAKRDSNEAFGEALRAILRDDVLPAFVRYRTYLNDVYTERAREELGVSSLPDGIACYEAYLRSYTSISRSSKEVFDLGSATVDRYRKDVIEIGSEAYGLTDFGEIVAAVSADPENRFSSRAEFETFARDFVHRSAPEMQAWFDTVPDDTVIVEPHPTYLDGTGVSSRYEGAAGDNPAVFRINSYEWESENKGSAERLAVHEAFPGHHLQISIARKIKGLHPLHMIVGYSGFSEGWARYSEALAEEMALYEYEATKITRRAWPARGMVVDPGIHVFGWSRERAREFIMESGEFSEESANRMVDRISVLPGQLTSYDSGGLEIFALRREAEARFGEDFRISLFHDRVLENGPIPLGLLRLHIENWIKE